MMPPCKQSQVAFNLDVDLEKPEQKRKRSFMPTTGQQQKDQFHVYSNENSMMSNEQRSNDSVQLSDAEPYPNGTHMFSRGLDSSAFFNDRQNFYSRMVESSSCGVFPFRGPELVEHSANPSATVFLSRHNADFPGARHQERSLDSAAAATAQAMANFQALIDQQRSSPAAAGFQAYHHGSNSTQNPSLRVSHRQTTSLAPNRPQEFHPNQGFSSLSSFGPSSFCQATAQNSHLAAGDPAATTEVHGSAAANYGLTHGTHGSPHEAYGANAEAPWPTGESTLFPDLPSPCSPRGHGGVDTVFLSEAQEEYLQHVERLNSEVLLPADSPPHRGRRLSYSPPPSNDYSIFHPLELHHHPGSQEQHLHVYFDELGFPVQTEIEEAAPAIVSTPVDEFAAVPRAFSAQEENISLSFEPPPAAVAAGEKEIASYAFDLNEVPVSVGEATPPKPRKKYHPRVAKDKRLSKRRVDGKKVPAAPGDSVAKSNSLAKKSATKRAGQQTTTQSDTAHEEGRDSSNPEVVDMDIEKDMTTTVAATQHDTTICDCEACIKLRLEWRNATASAPNSGFTSANKLPQSPAHSNSPSARRTLFQSSPASEFDQNSNEAPAERLAASPDHANAVVTTSYPEEAQAYSTVRSFFNFARASSCLQLFEESVKQLGWEERQPQEEDAAESIVWNQPFETMSSTFTSRLCPRGILSPQHTPFRDMNQIQRVVYLKSVLSSNPQLKMSPESLLLHVRDHLPEDEKEEFQAHLWPIILKPLSDEQTKQLKHYAISEQPQKQKHKQKQKQKQVQGTEVVVVKRKPGPKPKKKGLAMTLCPNLVESTAITNVAAKGRTSKKKNTSAVEDGPQNHGMEMVPYETNNSSDKSVVVYETGKTVVVYEGPLLPLRKKKPRAKVVLDGETVRVWKLLMGKPASASAENMTDAENELKWEEERRKMEAQALRFIERMHIVQGDRSFSCWKGSVVDSVVGAFLTQNVNDVLSSSAFMSMRSRFPGRGSSPSQTKDPEDAEDAENDTPPSPAPQITESSTLNTAAPEFPRTSVTTRESQESRNQESSYETAAATSHIPWQNHEESAASTVSEVSNPPEEATSSGLFASTIPDLISPAQALPQDLPQARPQGEQSKAQSEDSSGLEYQLVQTEGSTNQADTVVSSENAVSTEGRALVEGYHEPSHGKYNRKTDLTGLERAKIEEKQVTARKSFDFSAFNDQFKPRMAGETRPPAAPRTAMTEDGVDWEAVRAADVQAVADVIKERGLNWILAGRIKAFLERLHLDYGDLDLEWLRSMSTDQTKEFLLSVRGLGLKSVECIRLLTLHHLAFPVDTNVGRICVRLGWVPLEPLPEELQLHLLELYPVQATIQKYLWPRLCKLDQQTLYELHYQMITFGKIPTTKAGTRSYSRPWGGSAYHHQIGWVSQSNGCRLSLPMACSKVFCTKSKPNCNACPMRPECKHFASALSSPKLALPASERPNNDPKLALPLGANSPQDRGPEPPRLVPQYCCQPIVEEPMTPDSKVDFEVFDIEDYPFTVEEVEANMDISICIQDSQAPAQLVQQSKSINDPICHNILSITDTYATILESELVSKPVSKQIETLTEDWGGLATSRCHSVQLGITCKETQSSLTSVIEIVDTVCEEVLDLENSVNNINSNNPKEILLHTAKLHEMVLVPPGVASLPVPKLKNIGRLQTVHYVYELPDNHPLLERLDPKEHDDPCTYLLAIWSPGEVPQSVPNMKDNIDEENPFAASNFEREESIKATLLVPCRTAMQGSFPLNGTYFQVNEVFADHASSLQPILVPRTFLWNLRRRFVYFGTSVTSIFRGMTVEEIQACFWRGYVCVRGFDRATRAPKPLVGRLHLQSGRASGKRTNAES